VRRSLAQWLGAPGRRLDHLDVDVEAILGADDPSLIVRQFVERFIGKRIFSRRVAAPQQHPLGGDASGDASRGNTDHCA